MFAAVLAVIGVLCLFFSSMIMGKGGQAFIVAFYAFLILAAVRLVWVVVSRGRSPERLPIPDRKAQWLLGGSLAFVIWWTLSTAMEVRGPWQPWGMVIGLIRVVTRGAWAALTGQSPSADLFPF